LASAWDDRWQRREYLLFRELMPGAGLARQTTRRVAANSSEKPVHFDGVVQAQKGEYLPGVTAAKLEVRQVPPKKEDLERPAEAPRNPRKVDSQWY
jgi:hypothetical protein